MWWWRPVRWEYRMVGVTTSGSPTGSDPDLQALGQAGWEAVGLMSSGQFCRVLLKRRVAH